MTRPTLFLIAVSASSCDSCVRILFSDTVAVFCFRGHAKTTTYLTLAHFWPGVRKLLLTRTCSSGLLPLLMALSSPLPRCRCCDMLARMTVGVNFCICFVLRRGCLLGSALLCVLPPFSLCWGFRCVFRYEKKKENLSCVYVCVSLARIVPVILSVRFAGLSNFVTCVVN